MGLSVGLLGVVLMFREARRAQNLADRIAADALALRSAYSELDGARVSAEAQAAQLRATLAGMSDGIVMLDADLRLVQWNRRFAEIIGFPERSLAIGAPIADAFRALAEAGELAHPGTEADIEAQVAHCLAILFSGATAEHVRPNGGIIETRSTRLPDGGSVTLCTDITARRQAEAAERAAAAAAAEAVRQRQQFVTLVSHEIRVPLEAVTRSLALLDESALPAPAAELVSGARRVARSLADLVSDILDLSRLDAGRLVLRPADFELATLLADAGAMFRAAAADKGITLLTVVDAGLPSALHGDAGRIRQVLINFLSNAVKYAGPGVVTLRAAPAGGMLKLTVADPGPVIPPHQAAALFQPFSRLEAAELGGEAGTGLGLAISARLAGLMGGEIGHAPEAGGNAFWLTLPLEPARGEDGVGSAAALRRHGRPARVLLVEDVASNRDLTAALLRRHGHRVDLAADGITAVERASTVLYDVILMDIHMPGIDGAEAARRIRALDGPAGRVAIVALTGTSASAAGIARLEGTMDAVLLKPTRSEDLFAVLQRFTDPWLARPAQPVHAARDTAAVLDAARIDSLRDGLAPAHFARLVEQCLAELEHRLRALVPGEGLREGAHALAGMAASYGLCAFENLMRRLIDPAADEAAITRTLAEAEAALAQAAKALRATLATAEAA
jgi:signal transduction histidine kinase/FixJ family two-component response regulator